MSELDKDITLRIKQYALDLGFDFVGITSPEIPEIDKEIFEKWLDSGYESEMEYMRKNVNLRLNPKEIFPEVKSIIVVAMAYYPECKPETVYDVSKYAYGRDYHKIIKSKLKLLSRKIEKEFPDIKSRPFVDSAPVLERSLAVKAGLGWIGKNKCLINKQAGSFLFLGELFVSLDLKQDLEIGKNYCGNCSLCIDSCPTGALSKDGVDSSKCISYHTIESSKEIPENIKLKGSLFGCDICQDVCPWNRKPLKFHVQDLFPGKHLESLNIETLQSIDDTEFVKIFAGTPFMRTGRSKLIQTIQTIMLQTKNDGTQ
jgi:epoxyqueuosine reductase